MKLKEMCEDEMPREKMMSKGPWALSNSELLAILLRVGRHGKNAVDVARELLMSGGGNLAGIAGMDLERICRIDGVGPSKAVTIAAAFELGKRAAMEENSDRSSPLSSPKAVFQMMLPIMKNLDHEECWILLLNKSNRLIEHTRMSMGGEDSTIIDSRMIIRKAIDRKASAVIIVHNHPSGNAYPSKADISQTQALHKALKTCDLALLDHVIIAGNCYYSFADETMVEGVDSKTVALNEKFCDSEN